MMLNPQERYGYVSLGNSQDLDLIVISSGLVEALAPGCADIVHVIAEYSTRPSDHDLLVTRFLVPPPPRVCVQTECDRLVNRDN